MAQENKPSQRRRDKPVESGPEDEGLEDALKHVGARAREFRHMQDLTLVQVSEFTGIPQAELSRLELGQLNFTARTAHRVARALGVHLYELFLPTDLSGVRPKRSESKKKKGS